MKTIQLKSKGAEVRILQELLNLNGYQVAVDGIFGSGTEKAVKDFQGAHQDRGGKALAIDGVVGPASWQALIRYDTSGPDKPQRVTSDSYTLKKIALIHPKIRDELKEIYQEILDRKIGIRITDTLRTFEQQTKLYNQGRTTAGSIVTNAKAGQSYHNYGLAVDFAILLPGGRKVSWDMNLDLNANNQKDWNEVVAVFKHYGWEWGGNWKNFKDYPHFEKTFGYSTRQLLEKYNNGEVIDGYVDI